MAKNPADRYSLCREFAAKLGERAAVDSESDRGTEAGITVAAPTTGSETQVAVRRPPGGAAQSARHSVTPQPTTTKSPPRPKGTPPPGTEPPPTATKQKRRRWPRILVGSAVAVVVCAAIVATVYLVKPKRNATPAPATSTPAPAAAVLDGTYRLDYDLAKHTQNGAPNPNPNTDKTVWWAFRSSCTSTGFVATGTDSGAGDPSGQIRWSRSK